MAVAVAPGAAEAVATGTDVMQADAQRAVEDPDQMAELALMQEALLLLRDRPMSLITLQEDKHLLEEAAMAVEVEVAVEVAISVHAAHAVVVEVHLLAEQEEPVAEED